MYRTRNYRYTLSHGVIEFQGDTLGVTYLKRGYRVLQEQCISGETMYAVCGAFYTKFSEYVPALKYEAVFWYSYGKEWLYNENISRFTEFDYAIHWLVNMGEAREKYCQKMYYR